MQWSRAVRQITRASPYSWVNTSPVARSAGPLAGRAIAIKENISYTAAPTSCSSLVLKDYYPPYNATCVDLLLGAGAHIAGQTKMDEFGMGSETTHLPPDYSPVYNPIPSDPPRSAGGSSGGSAVAVGEGSAWAALGTDTGGSVRLPASYCGVVGLKPSYGLISRYGVVSYADSLDCVGVLARTVDQVEQVFDVISQPDHRDMTCVSARPPVRSTGLRIGLPIQTHLAKPYIQLSTTLLEHLKSIGAELVPVDLPTFRVALPAYYVLASAEASSNLARYGGAWFGKDRSLFGKEVKMRILAGTYALSANEFNNTYLKALHLRHLLKRELAQTFQRVDMLLHPTAIQTAPLHSHCKSEYLQDLLTVPASLAGLPAMSVPAGRSDGWPVGVSVVGRWGTEKMLFKVGKEIEQVMG